LGVKRSERLGVRWVRDLDRALALLMPLRAFECCIIGASPIGDWVRERLMTVASGTPVDIRIRKIVVRKIFLMDDDLHYTPLGWGIEGFSPHFNVVRPFAGVFAVAGRVEAVVAGRRFGAVGVVGVPATVRR